ncbi:MAG TPA: hypothetical protein H9829_07395 [Candidatus Tetragenococcus pullicola]|nr:hypothetical protein [Candidatus Tetragenococcus pullicola]
MIIDTNKINQLLASDMTGYRVAQITNVRQSMYDRYKSGKTPVVNMTIKVADELMNLIKLEENAMYKLIIKEEGKLQTVENFESFEALKSHLITTNYFGWINDNEPDRELPDFTDAESVREINAILDDYDYDWWTASVVENA